MKKQSIKTSFNHAFQTFNIIVFIISCLTVLSVNTFATETTGISQYRLGTGDNIQINVFDEPDLSITVLLGKSGIINLTFLNEIKVTGLTTRELEILITNGLKPDYIVNPSVQVSVIGYRPFFIDGEVNNPGGYPYQPGLNVSKAIALAGGSTERASLSSIFIIRATDKAQKKVKVSLNDNIYPGDIITIDESFF